MAEQKALLAIVSPQCWNSNMSQGSNFGEATVLQQNKVFWNLKFQKHILFNKNKNMFDFSVSHIVLADVIYLAHLVDSDDSDDSEFGDEQFWALNLKCKPVLLFL